MKKGLQIYQRKKSALKSMPPLTKIMEVEHSKQELTVISQRHLEKNTSTGNNKAADE